MDPVRASELLRANEDTNGYDSNATDQHKDGKEAKRCVGGILEALDVCVDVPARCEGFLPIQRRAVQEGHGGVEEGSVQEQQQPPQAVPVTRTALLQPANGIITKPLDITFYACIC